MVDCSIVVAGWDVAFQVFSQSITPILGILMVVDELLHTVVLPLQRVFRILAGLVEIYLELVLLSARRLLYLLAS